MPHRIIRQLLTILFGLFGTSTLFGQIQHDVNKVLASKDFVVFKKYADNMSGLENGISSKWLFLRDLTTDFQEAVFIFEKSVPYKDNPYVFSVKNFRVTIITTETNIAYYELSEQKYKKAGNHMEPYYKPIVHFKDKKAFENVKSSFKDIFQSNLNEKELFVTDFAYGSHCGYGGSRPEGRVKIDYWVTEKNKTELLKWLKSTNTEKQVYAVDGLLQLEKLGVKLTEEEIKIINFICSKNGTMFVCSGCMHFQNDIRRETNKFKQ